ncbi:hypothetical protein R6Q57_001535 [Mikania cordata]
MTRNLLRRIHWNDDGFGNIIVVDNLPVMPKEKFEKLKSVVQQINSQIEVIKHNGLYMSVEEDTANNFIECKTTQLILLKKRVWIQARQSTQFSVMFNKIEKFMSPK